MAPPPTATPAWMPPALPLPCWPPCCLPRCWPARCPALPPCARASPASSATIASPVLRTNAPRQRLFLGLDIIVPFLQFRSVSLSILFTPAAVGAGFLLGPFVLQTGRDERFVLRPLFLSP